MRTSNLKEIRLTLAAAIALCCAGHAEAAAPTTTNLSITSQGHPVTTVVSPSVVTFTATVTAGSTPVTVGQVKFCRGALVGCHGIQLLGTAQLTAAGTATFRFRPGVSASRDYTAVFLGTGSYAASASTGQSLAVTGTATTTTSIAQSGAAGNYTLTATVTGPLDADPTGTVSFLDTSRGNAMLGEADLFPQQLLLSFGNIPTAVSGQLPATSVVGDFNGDGIPDLVFQADSAVSVLLGNGDGTFRTGANLSTGIFVSNMVTGDFNGDGNTDIACLNIQPGADTVTVFLGDGQGNFTAQTTPVSFGPSAIPGFIQTADVNGDGIADLVVLGYSGGGDGVPLLEALLGLGAGSGQPVLTVLLGKGDGTFPTGTSTTIPGTLPQTFVTGDFNGDGKLDAVVLNGTNNLTVLLGNGDGSFSIAPESPVVNEPAQLAAGYFLGHAAEDLVVTTNHSGLVMLIGNGDGTFSTGPTSPAPAGNEIAVTDLNNDDIPDLVLTDINWNFSGPGSVVALIGDGTGKFSQSSSLTAATVYDIPFTESVADFNGDGIPDVAATSFSYDPSVPIDANGASALSLFQTKAAWTSTASVSHVAPVGAGTHLAEASYSGDSSYTGSVSGTTPLAAAGVKPYLRVAPVPPTNGVTYGSPIPALTGYAITGFVNGDTQATAVTGTPVLSTTATSTSPTGFYPIVVTPGTLSAPAYNLFLAQGRFYIYKAPLVGTIQNVTIHRGQPIPAFTYTLAGFLNGDTQATAVSGTPVITSSATSNSAPGKYAIHGTIGTLAAQNYYFVGIDGTLTILP